jgi:hypothetical protein
MAIFLPLAQVLFPQTSVQNYQLTLSFAYNISTRTIWKTQFFHCCGPTVGLIRICSQATGTCLPNRCPETDLVYPPNSGPLHSNDSTRYTARSLRLFVPYRHFALFEGCACDVCVWPHLPPRGSVCTVFTFQMLPLPS